MWGMCSGRRSFAHGSDAPAEGAVRETSASSVASPATGATLAITELHHQTEEGSRTLRWVSVRECPLRLLTRLFVRLDCHLCTCKADREYAVWLQRCFSD